eukprot:CAMPEP_0202946532 /NCGR_PEP_ID=MMETSP1395-20130829/9309_1 /ASSEMBLY_ACC=CAM_ASM_000871 /TAXON_ID=5961 /ORGANISM="Blepharisma japonicum, Strain Stock R1072" /LENGTH=301 /DNA_ID=CAMNT_0049647197 /DNA_START=86 /DNA_END=991 /DNA_ORIENTATION=-
MAIQLDVAYSSVVTGVGAFAAAPYYCAQGSEVTSKTACMLSSYLINVDALVQYTKDMASEDNIDDVHNIAQDNIWLFSGSLDTEVHQDTVKKTQQYFSNFVNAYKINSTFDVAAENAWVTNGYGNPCWYLGAPYLSHCQYDAAGYILKQLYGSLAAPKNQNFSNLYTFDQSEFVSSFDSGMVTYGWIYQPWSCLYNPNCKVHVALHGCGMNYGAIGDVFIKNTGLNTWAESNGIVIIYPQVLAQQVVNPAGCWDWWGYTGSDYAWKSGPQMLGIYNITQNIDTITSHYRPNISAKLSKTGN